MLAKINKITTLQATIIIAVVGIIVFVTGLTRPFLGDDLTQIVNNIPVHSITHIRLFFESGTFYNGLGLTGAYYRPLITTVFSLLYTLFGPHPIYYHLLQLFLCISSATLLFLVFRYSFKPVISLILSLIFLVHPLNSQVAFAIPSMQDALFFFFGILSFWLLLRFKSRKSLTFVAGCLFLSMLSKETAVVFIVMLIIYLFWFNRERLYAFIGIMILPIGIYLALRINAIGLIGHSTVAPIDNLSLAGRLFTAPSVVLFFISKLVFPWRLATAYYWIHPTFSFRYFIMPIVVILMLAGLAIYVGNSLRQKVSKAKYYTYLFFAAWTVVGILPYLQIIPLDMTIYEAWFYFSIVGILGMLGIVIEAYKVSLKWIVIISIVVIGPLGVRSAFRGLDYSSEYSLSSKDIIASPSDYVAYNNVAGILLGQGKAKLAKSYAQKSVKIFPTSLNLNNLGLSFANTGNYSLAEATYNQGLNYNSFYRQSIYENLADLTIVYGNASSDSQFFTKAVKLFPQDPKIFLYLAIVEDEYNDNPQAKVYITKAAALGQVPQVIYNDIMNNKPFVLNFNGTSRFVNI